MGEVIGFKDKINADVVRNASSEGRFTIGSKWDWELWRDGKLIDSWSEHNMVTNEGINSLLGVGFDAVTQITEWYICLWKSNTTPLATHTYAVPAYTELPDTDFDEAARQAFTGVVSDQVITNTASKATFTVAAGKSYTVYGGALVGGGTAADTSEDTAGGGVLFCSSAFTGGSKVISAADVLQVTVSITGAHA